MSMRRVVGGEGASVPWLRSEFEKAPVLVVCPMLPYNAGTDASMIQEIYQMAYARAQAALRPSAYEFAQRPCWN